MCINVCKSLQLHALGIWYYTFYHIRLTHGTLVVKEEPFFQASPMKIVSTGSDFRRLDHIEVTNGTHVVKRPQLFWGRFNQRLNTSGGNLQKMWQFANFFWDSIVKAHQQFATQFLNCCREAKSIMSFTFVAGNHHLWKIALIYMRVHNESWVFCAMRMNHCYLFSQT